MTTQSITSFMGLFVSFRKKRLYQQSRESFYESRNFLNSSDRLSGLINNTSSNTLETEKPIKFYGLEFGVTLKKAIKHLGKPNYVGKPGHLLKKHRVLYYRISISGVKSILQLHFLKDAFFLGLIEVRSADGGLKSDVAQLIMQKYGLEKQEGWTGTIRDRADHRIEMKNDIVPYIVYESGEAWVKEEIADQLAQEEAKRQKHYDKKSDLLLEMI